MSSTIENINLKTESDYIGKLAQYNITKTLGVDHLNPVYLAQTAESNETYVVKTMNLSDVSFLNECKIFELPEHKNIIKAKEILSGVSADIQVSAKPKKETLQNAVVMELAENGDLFNFLAQGALPEKIARYFFEQVLDAVEHIHSNKFCHLDIKLENILLDKDYTVKLTDFGFATEIEEGKRLNKKVGTPSYRPPEMWKIGPNQKGYDGIKADVFQLGVLLFIFITGTPAFLEANSGDVWYRLALNGKWENFWNAKEKHMRTRREGPKGFDSNFKTLITNLLSPEEHSRPTIQEIRESVWYKNVQPATYEEMLAEMDKRKKQFN